VVVARVRRLWETLELPPEASTSLEREAFAIRLLMYARITTMLFLLISTNRFTTALIEKNHLRYGRESASKQLLHGDLALISFTERIEL
jgi:hypothetical protein